MDVIVLSLLKNYINSRLEGLGVSGYGIDSITQSTDPTDENISLITIKLTNGKKQILKIANGTDYVLTEQDKEEIADITAQLVYLDDVPQEVYVGDGEMPEEATIQIIPSIEENEDEEEEFTAPNPFALEIVGQNKTTEYDGRAPKRVDLSEYLDLSSYATHEEVKQDIANFDFIKIVSTRPVTGYPNRIYLIPIDNSVTNDLFEEWLWVNKGTEENPDWDWKKITNKQIQVDLTDYVTTTILDNEIKKAEQYADNAALNTLELVYPVGSIYLTLNATSPATLFGFGTWKKLTNRFLVGAGDNYEVNSTGGSATHTLTASQLPKQEGTISMHGTYAGTAVADVKGVFSKQSTVTGKYMVGESGTNADSVDIIKYSNGGTGEAHNNMPPYISAAIWRRIA